MSESFAAYWASLPAQLAASLAKGSVGSGHLTTLASGLLGGLGPFGGSESDARLAGELLLAAWEEDPLNGELAAQLLRLDGRVYALTPACRGALSFAAASWRLPPDAGRLEALTRDGDYDASARRIDAGLIAEPENLYWLREAWQLALADGRLPWFTEHFSRYNHQQQPLLRFIQGCLLLVEGGGDDSDALVKDAAGKALPLFEELAASEQVAPEGGRASSLSCLHWAVPAELYAHCLALLGREREAQKIWATELSRRPWRVNLALRLYDSALPGRPLASNFAADTALLLYSFNKEAELAATLTSLAPSARRFRKILVLDNGGTDGTAALLRASQVRLGADLFTPIFLPVNVGAPAARNWLAARPEALACEYLLYLDDDALVSAEGATDPAAWLGHLARALERYPDASAWGLKIRDHILPWQAQSVDLHLDRAGDAPGVGFSLTSALGHPFAVSGLHAQGPDFGRFTYTRPCLSVTGCCHLLRTKEFQEQGGFNLVFSPSQYDDLERDLRLGLSGRYACYHGHFSVRHLKRTGRGNNMSRAQYGNGLANSYKLAGRFTAEELETLFAFQDNLLTADLQAKLTRLDELYPELSG